MTDMKVGEGADTAVNGRSTSVEHSIGPEALAVREQITARVGEVAALSGCQVGQRHYAARILGIMHKHRRRQIFRQLIWSHASLFQQSYNATQRSKV